MGCISLQLDKLFISCPWELWMFKGLQLFTTSLETLVNAIKDFMIWVSRMLICVGLSNLFRCTFDLYLECDGNSFLLLFRLFSLLSPKLNETICSERRETV